MNNLLICVLSCQPYVERRARCLGTWVSETRQSGIDVVFVIGSPAAQRPQRDGELLIVPSADDYASLPDKVREMCRWALDETDCDWLFKCDDDTYVRSDRLLAVDVRGHDYVGAEWTPGAGYASGGAGYLLSRRSLRIVAETISQAACEAYPPGAEDLLVGRCLKQAGVPLCIDQRFIAYGDDTLRPQPHNQLISAHACQQPWLAHQIEFQGQTPTVTCQTSGRLGNLLFQVAAAVGFARRYGTHRAVFDEASLGRYRSTVFRNLDTGATSGDAVCAGDAPDFSYNAIPHDPRCSVVICGYMQSEKYFDHCRNEIRELFLPAPAERRSLQAKYASLLGPQTISLHVRRGDYVSKPEYHPLQPVEYYVQAIRHIEQRAPVARILCFSDDPGWCQAHLAFDPRVEVMVGEPDYLDLALMSMCRHHVIANSAFSWWGAWLNAEPGKIVVAPACWLGPAFVGWTDRDLVPEGWTRLDAGQAAAASIHPHGYWCGGERLPDHAFDPQLCAALESFLRSSPGTLADFGCGTGDYIRNLRNAGICCEGYDGNPHTETLSGGIAQILDLAQPADLGQIFDWVLSLEVGEHIPPEFEATYIDNLHRHNRRGVILSWAVPGQGGHGHCNELENDRVRDTFRGLGYESDSELERTLRESVTVCSWLRHTIMVFRRQLKQPASDRGPVSSGIPRFPHGLNVPDTSRVRLGLFYGSCGTHDGPAKLAQNLIGGLQRCGIEVHSNEVCEVNACLQFWAPEYQRLPRGALMGPNLVVAPSDDPDLWRRHCNFIVPSLWVKRFYERYDLTQGASLSIVSAGVDTEVFTDDKRLTQDAFVYFKHRSEADLSIVETALRRRNLSYSVVRYGHFKECDLVATAQRSRFCVLVAGTESDGIANKEIMSTNTPCFVWNTSIWRYGSYPECPASSVPWFDDRCGMIVDQFSDEAFDCFHANVEFYEPRNYILENHTLERGAQRYFDAVLEAHRNPVS
ncbi:MAG TPA: alpha-1,2-fucosyltransferase [Planctomycetaceae bacterium]